MSHTGIPIVTDEELGQAARGNASALPYLLAAFALDSGRTADDAAAFMGRTFAAGWEEARGQGARTAVRLMALNIASGGADVLSVTGDERHAEARLTGYPDAEALALYGLAAADAERILGCFGPIATHLSLRADWRRDGDEIVLIVDQPVSMDRS